MPAVLAQCEGTWLRGDTYSEVSFAPYVLCEWDSDGIGPSTPKIIVGGNFQIPGAVPILNIGSFDSSTRGWSPLGTGLNGSIYALEELPNGQLAVAGGFLLGGGLSRVAAWDGSNWLSLGSGVNDVVHDLAITPNGDLIAGGEFTIAGGTAANRVARWDGVSWNALAGGANYIVQAVAAGRDRTGTPTIVMGGLFNQADGLPSPYIAQWTGTSWASMGAGMNGPVDRVLVHSNGDIFAAGYFNIAGGVPAPFIAKWDGQSWSALAGGVNSNVNDFAVLLNGDLACGGVFSTAGGVVRYYLAKWTGEAWEDLASGITDWISALTPTSDGRLVVAGAFGGDDRFVARNIAEWDGTSWQSLSSGLDGPIFTAAALADGRVVVGGAFVRADGQRLRRLAEWDGVAWTPVGGGVGDGAQSVQIVRVGDNGDLIVGGAFSITDGIITQNIARWNGLHWSAFASGLNNSVSDIAFMPNGDMIAAGRFSASGSVALQRIARWDGNVWAPLGTGVSDGVFTPSVNSLVVWPNGDLIAGGTFNRAGSIAANSIARWDGTTWHALGTGVLDAAGRNGQVVSLARLGKGDLIAGGRFVRAGGVLASNVARWNGLDWSPLGEGFDSHVAELLGLPSGEVVAVGSFTHSGGVEANRIAKWTGTSWVPLAAGLSVAPTTNFEITAEAVAYHPSGELIVAGRFLQAGTEPSAFFARWTDTGVAWIARQPTGAVVPNPHCGIVEFIVEAAAGYDAFDGLTYRWMRDGVDLTDGTTPHGSQIAGTSTPTLQISNATFLDSGAYSCAVLNQCGSANSIAAQLLSCNLLADLNCNGEVSTSDLAILLSNYGNIGTPSNSEGNVDGDDRIDLTDLAMLLADFGMHCD